MSKHKSPLKTGDELGSCLIRELIGRGKDTEVYVAFAPGLRQEVAIKTLRLAGTSTGELDACFREDMQPIAELKHPNIVRIYDFDVTDDRYYIIMELIKGTGLRDLIFRHPTGLERNETVRIFNQLASAVATAHDHKVVHGNIKPDNVLLDLKQRPVLTDFIIPCLHRRRSELGWVPNPTYLAPEQLTANRSMPESDIYALGILLYEMATGDVPFKGKPQDIIDQHQNVSPIPPAQINVNLDPRINSVIMQALNKQPMSRFSSARDMLAALENEEVQSEFSTLALNRNDMQAPLKRASEIRRFRETRLADPEPESAIESVAGSIPKPSPRPQILWLGAALLIIVVIVLAALFLF
jgi:serine/threonine protein kinase